MWQKLAGMINVRTVRFSQQLNTATFHEPEGYTETHETPLLPFKRTADRFWNTSDCLDVNVLGYCYQELNLTDERLRAIINHKYGWLAPNSIDREPAQRSQTGFPIDFGRNNSLAPCLSRTVLIENGSVFPSVIIDEGVGIRAVRSVDPEILGVEKNQRRKIDVAVVNLSVSIDAEPLMNMMNPNSTRQWDALVRFEK